MDIFICVVLVVVMIVAAIGPLGVLMGVMHVCGKATSQGEHDPIEAMENRRRIANRHVPRD